MDLQKWQFHKHYELSFIKCLTQSIIIADEKTMQGINSIIRNQVQLIKQYFKNNPQKVQFRSPSTISGLSEMFKLCIRKGFKKYQRTNNYNILKTRLVQICNQLQKIFLLSKNKVVQLSRQLISNGNIILTISNSEVVLQSLINAKKQGKYFYVFVCQTQPKKQGIIFYNSLIQNNIDAKLIKDCQIGSKINMVDYVVSGAQMVYQNGGILNRVINFYQVGTCTIGLVAKTLRKPFYVLCQCFKLTRKNAQDVRQDTQIMYIQEGNEYPLLDYTPPQYISLFITDMGMMTKNEVSQRLIEIFAK